jgi:two-component system response regulator NreC
LAMQQKYHCLKCWIGVLYPGNQLGFMIEKIHPPNCRNQLVQWDVNMPINVILADDHQVILDSLTRFINEEVDMEVAGTARNGAELIKLAEELRPDIAVVDISLPDISGIEAVERMLEVNPALKVICLSMHHDMKNLMRMLRAGAKAYISKGSASRELIRAIRSVAEGNYFLCPELTTTMIEVFLHSISEDILTSAPILSPREREVLAPFG